MNTKRTFPAWPEEEPISVEPPTTVRVVGGRPHRRHIRRIAVVRDIGPHVALYAIAAWLLVFLALVLLSGLVRIFHTFIQLLASFN